MRVQISIKGIVQGVGFRPTVYRYASEYGLTGMVSNTVDGVIVEVQGLAKSIDNFIDKLKKNPPSAGRIDLFEFQTINELNREDKFKIIKSHGVGNKEVLISPDLALCNDCLSEMFDYRNRRYLHPFINCTNCGPRFTIIKDRPYDRKFTSMNIFQMCDLCSKEYNNPLDRRFHAQPNACPKCGAHLYFIDEKKTDHLKILSSFFKRLASGDILGLKSIGGFNITCDPFQKRIIEKLRVLKSRPNQAFALMARDLETVKKYCVVDKSEEKLLTSSISPVVLLRKKNDSLDHISPDNNYLGIMLPYTPLHHLIMKEFPLLVMTSANLRKEPMAISDDEIRKLIQYGLLDSALSNNREIVNRVDDSIIQVIDEDLQVIRRSRGIVPLPIKGKANSNKKLSLGAYLKNTFCLEQDGQYFMSQHIGDLEDDRNFEYQQEQITQFKSLLSINEDKVYKDAHPNFFCEYDENHFNISHVYHHYAHMMSVIGEHQLENKDNIIGVICDGTGYGTDGKIWGFEVLEKVNNQFGFSRIGHLDYFPLPGGEKAIREIDRIGISLFSCLEKDHGHLFIPYSEERKKQITSLIKKNINCPETSSLGRLFDGMASLFNILQASEYEARGAILLQKDAEEGERIVKKQNIKIERWNPEMTIKNGKYVLLFENMIYNAIMELNKGESVSILAYKFHLWIVDSILLLIENYFSYIIVFSGGCFQNKLLSSLLRKSLEEKQVKFYFNSQIPTNDAGISFGQLIV